MGLVIPLKKEIDNSYTELKNLVKGKLDQVNQRIKYKLASEINLIHKMTSYHLKSGGKRIRPLLTLSSSKPTSLNLKQSKSNIQLLQPQLLSTVAQLKASH